MIQQPNMRPVAQLVERVNPFSIINLIRSDENGYLWRSMSQVRILSGRTI